MVACHGAKKAAARAKTNAYSELYGYLERKREGKKHADWLGRATTQVTIYSV